MGNNILMTVGVRGGPESTLFADLLDTNCVSILADLYGNLVGRTNETGRLEAFLPILENETVAAIRLRRETGEIAVYHLTLREGLAGGEAVEPGKSVRASAAGGVGGSDPVQYEIGGVPQGGAGQADSSGGGTAALQQAGRGKVIYVDATRGHDDNDGFAAAVESNRHGPKKTVNGALRAAREGDSISIGSGTYRETSDFRGRGVTVYFTGTVFM